MGVIFDTLAKTDPSVRNCTSGTLTPQAARSVMKDLYPGVDKEPLAKRSGSYTKTVGNPYPTGNDTFEPVDALGSASGDASTQDEGAGVDEINLDATLFDQKVRELVENAGGQYNYKAAAQAGLVKRVNPEVLAAVQRLEANAGLLNKAVRLTNERLSKRQTQRTRWHSTGSVSGSVSGATSADEAAAELRDEEDVGAARKVVIKAMAGHIAERLRLMGRRGQA